MFVYTILAAFCASVVANTKGLTGFNDSYEHGLYDISTKYTIFNSVAQHSN